MDNILHSPSEPLAYPELSRAYSKQNGTPYDDGTFWEWDGLELVAVSPLASALEQLALEINQTRDRPHPTASTRSCRPIPRSFLALRDAVEKVVGSLVFKRLSVTAHVTGISPPWSSVYAKGFSNARSTRTRLSCP